MWGCTNLGTDLNQVVAVEVSLPYGGNVELADTIFPSSRALDGRGDSVAAIIYWKSLDTAHVTVLDSTTGATLGKAVGAGQIQARVGNLRSNPVAITVVAAPDTLYATVATRDSLSISAKGDSLSDTLRVAVADTNGGTLTGISGRKVGFQITYPTDPAAFTLLPGDTVLTGAGGIATLFVKLKNRTLPDSVVLTAAAQHIRGAAIAGSPITFTVIFAP
ncbi:MAG TPA: hypothetical protein VI139_02155 [Gemmatimonadales bacterium]